MGTLRNQPGSKTFIPVKTAFTFFSFFYLPFSTRMLLTKMSVVTDQSHANCLILVTGVCVPNTNFIENTELNKLSVERLFSVHRLNSLQINVNSLRQVVLKQTLATMEIDFKCYLPCSMFKIYKGFVLFLPLKTPIITLSMIFCSFSLLLATQKTVS